MPNLKIGNQALKYISRGSSINSTFYKTELIGQMLVFGEGIQFFFPCKMFVNSKSKTILLVFTSGNERSPLVARRCTDHKLPYLCEVSGFSFN